MTSKVDGSSLIIKRSGDMVSSYFQITKMAQASRSNTRPPFQEGIYFISKGLNDVLSSFGLLGILFLVFFFLLTNALCYNFSYFVLFTYVFSLFLEVSHGTATLTQFSLTHIAATLLTHSTAIVLTHSIAILIALPHWCSIYSGQSCRLFFS